MPERADAAVWAEPGRIRLAVLRAVAPETWAFRVFDLPPEVEAAAREIGGRTGVLPLEAAPSILQYLEQEGGLPCGL